MADAPILIVGDIDPGGISHCAGMEWSRRSLMQFCILPGTGKKVADMHLFKQRRSS